MSAFSDRIKQGLARIRATAGESVTYRRGEETIALTAVPGAGTQRGQQQDVTRIDSQRDWMIAVEDLDFGSGPVPPERGDQIDFETDVATYTFEALPQDGEHVYRFSDSAMSQYRIHTKVVNIV